MLEAGLSLDAGIVCIQELFFGWKNLAYLGFNFYWPAKTYDWKDNQVFIVVRKDLLNIIVIENRTDLINHSYDMVVDITERNIHGKGQKGKPGLLMCMTAS